MINVLILFSIFLAIAYGFITKRNSGFVAIAFSFIIGCFFMGMKPSEVIACWPIKVFFYVFAVTVFFNFSRQNGTLQKLSYKLLYSFRTHPKSLLFVLFFANLAMAALGVGNMPVEAMFAPIMIMVCEKLEISYLIGAIAVNFGSIAGANFMTSVNGMVFRGLIDDAGMPEVSFGYVAIIFLISIINPLIVLLVYNFTKGRKIGNHELQDFEKPEPFNTVQIKNLILMVFLLAIVLIGPIMKSIFKDNAIITNIGGKLDVSLVSIVFIVIASLMKIGDEKKAIQQAPWNTLILLSGVGMLINIASKAGLMDILAAWITGSIPTFFVPMAFALVGAFMSFFSSTIGVVCPVLFPIIPSVANLTGINPMVLFVSLVIGAQASAISPFSAAGSMLVGACTDEKTSTKLFKDQIIAIPTMLFMALISSFLLSILVK